MHQLHITIEIAKCNQSVKWVRISHTGTKVQFVFFDENVLKHSFEFSRQKQNCKKVRIFDIQFEFSREKCRFWNSAKIHIDVQNNLLNYWIKFSCPKRNIWGKKYIWIFVHKIQILTSKSPNQCKNQHFAPNLKNGQKMSLVTVCISLMIIKKWKIGE